MPRRSDHPEAKREREKVVRLTSRYAVLDVEMGRVTLRDLLAKNGRIPVVIHGYIRDEHGGDDGPSQEFGIDVTRAAIQGDRNEG
jgi:hypothetical protein